MEAHLVGEKEEDIVLSFQGTIPVIDKTGANPPETITLNPSSVKVDFLGDIDGVGLNVFRHSITHNQDTVLQLEFYAPLSVTEKAPSGTYQFSGTNTYALVPASTDNGLFRGAWFADVNGNKPIIKGQVLILQNDGKQSFQCRLIDETGRIIDVNYAH